MLPEVAKTAAQVTVFQRTPNFVMPAVQKPMTPEWEEEIKANYEQIIQKCRNHSFGMAFDSPVGRNLADTPPEEVQRILEEHWPRGSFRFVFETFDDLIVNAESNRVVGDFIIRKMKERVNDPEIAEILTPKGYPFFAKRPPLDHGYFEAFNRDNVRLVDIDEREPIIEFTETGIRTTKQHHEFDIIVLATGFQAYTGAQEALPIRGRNEPADLHRAEHPVHRRLHQEDGSRCARCLRTAAGCRRRVDRAYRGNPSNDPDGAR
jgi:cyclohexanone monooxygenase